MVTWFLQSFQVQGRNVAKYKKTGYWQEVSVWLIAAGLKNELMEWGLGKAFPGWWDTCMVGVRSVVLRAQGFWARNLLWSWNHKDQKR